jgi:hypothetical protein
MKRYLVLFAGFALVASAVSVARGESAAYKGSRFSDVWAEVTSDPYQTLPQQEVTLSSFFGWFEDRLLTASRRTLNDRSDVLPRFQKLLHPNGVCLAGTWRITEDSPYTGYFATGSEAQIIARASTALTETKAGQPRAFGLAGKLYPTTDPEHRTPLQTANFVTIENIGGTLTRHFLDAENTNDIIQISTSGGGGGLSGGAIAAAVAKAFATADGTIDLTQTLIRQLYPIAELGVPKGVPVATPRWMKLVGSAETPRINERDFRDELDMKHYPEGIHFDIYVADEGTRLGDKEWEYLGDVHFTDSVVSDSCDHRLHFAHTKFRK